MQSKYQKKPSIIIYLYIFLAVSCLYSSERYIWPVNTSKALTTVFGDIRPFRYHTGMDVRTFGINGLDVYAIQDGYISRIAVSTSGYGKVVYLTMVDGNTSVYAHLDRFNEKLELIKESLQNDCDCYSIDKTFSPGQISLQQGEIIGFTGDSGSLSGPHLHFEIRNKDGRPFNPLLSNYTVHDNISPIPERVVIHNLTKETRINGQPYKKELELTKISSEEYIYDGIISINGEFGISLEVYDKMNDQPFNFGIYNISLEIDGEKMYEAQYDNIGFEEGQKVFSERNFFEYNNKRNKVYDLYKKDNFIPSSFIRKEPSEKLILRDNSYHQCKITVYDYNNNKVNIGFIVVSNQAPAYKPIITYHPEGVMLQSYDSDIKKINISLADKFTNGLTMIANADSIMNNKYFIKNPNPGYQVLVSEPIYNSGSRGAPSYNLISDKKSRLEGKVNIIDNENGTIIQFIENEFTGMEPILGLTFKEKLFRYKLWRISKNILSSELFNPFELRDLTKISVIYQEPTEYEFELDIISEISIPDIPYEIKTKSIRLESHNTSSKNLKFDSSISNEKFMYIIPHINSEIKENINYIYGPFIVGPIGTPFNDKATLSYVDDSTEDSYGIYKYDSYNNKWKFSGNKLDNSRITSAIRSGGIFSIAKDTKPPKISKIIPRVNSTYRKDQFNKITFKIEDELSGISDENNIEVLLNGKKLIVEYNSYRGVVLYRVKNPLELGKHKIEINVTDNSNNTATIKGDFILR